MYDFDIENKKQELLILFEEFLGESRGHYESKNQIRFDCPNCSQLKGLEYDGKGNLEINYELGLYNCWACAETHGTKGFLINLFKNYASAETIRKFRRGGFVFDQKVYGTQEIRKEAIELPKEYIALDGKQKYNQFSEPFNYLYKRGITDEIIKKFHIGFCMGGKYANRVVIPSYDNNGDINYFITRSISSRTKKYKYLNPEIDKTSIIFNEYLIDWDKPIFIVEGVFDHIITPNSIPLLGKKLYEKIFNSLYFKSNNLIIIVLDNDAYDDTIKIYNKLDSGRLYKRVAINKMPKDMDLSSFNEIYGPDNLKKWLKEKTYRLND